MNSLGRPHQLSLGLDIGRVLSRYGRGDRWQNISGTCDDGAYVFLVLFMLTCRPDQLALISRTNAGVKLKRDGSPTWVTSFCQAIGLEEMGFSFERLHVCRNRSDKGALARDLGVNVFIDDNLECLVSVYRECPRVKRVHYNNSYPGAHPDPDGRWGLPDGMELIIMHDWRSLARSLQLRGSSDDHLWDEVRRRGPPWMPHSSSTLTYARNALQCAAVHALGPQRVVGLPDPEPRSRPPGRRRPRRACACGLYACGLHEPSFSPQRRVRRKTSHESEHQPEPGSTYSDSSSAQTAMPSSTGHGDAASASSWKATNRRDEKRVERAVQHQRMMALGIEKPPSLLQLRLCAFCGSCQPNVRCIFGGCRNCCPREVGLVTCAIH